MSFSTGLGMFFIHRRCTPPDGLYGIIDHSINVDRSLYGPIGMGCMALQTVRLVLILVCTGQLTFRRCSPSILKKQNLVNPSSYIFHRLYDFPLYLSTLCSQDKVGLLDYLTLLFIVSFTKLGMFS